MAESSLRFNDETPEILIAEGLAEVRLLMAGIEAQRQADFVELVARYNPGETDIL